jgi:uncharacterized membrane protein YoaK (UPF0700 family)
VNTYDRRVKLLATCLSGLAGYVDGLGFLALKGFFVSFMSGNSTRLSVSLAEGSENALIAGGLIAIFVLGVIIGSLVGSLSRDRRVAVLALVTSLLTIAALLSDFAVTRLAILFMALAMGAENAVFERDGEVLGLTYVTGALVKCGQRIAIALRGGDRLAWLPYLVLWLGLVMGAFLGALTYPVLGLDGLWIAAVVSAILAFAAHRL